jgi:hypothetical protein
LLLVACQEPYSNDDIVFLKALPPELAVDVPGLTATNTSSVGSGICAEPAEDFTPAKFYCDANKVATDVNKNLDDIFRLLNEIAAYPPTTREDDLRIWGPFPADDLEIVLSIERIRTSTIVRYTTSSTVTTVETRFRYLLQGRPRGVGDFVGVVYGESAPTGDAGGRMGWVALDLDGLHYLDPVKNTDRGAIGIAYDTRFDQTTLNVYLDINRFTPKFEPEAAYFYQSPNDGSGTLTFYGKVNLIETTDALETLAYQVRWRPDMRGRADVSVTGGDTPSPPGYYYVVQCWNARFEAVLQYVAPENLPGVVVFGDSIERCGPDLTAPP